MSEQNNYPDERGLHEMRGEIEETRGALSNTLDELQTRLNPENIKAQLTQSARDATIKQAEKLAKSAQAKAVQLQKAAAPLLEIAREKISEIRHKFDAKNGDNGDVSATSSTRSSNENALKPVDEQVVVVFGASSGIGRETAIRFAQQGASVVVAARGEEALKTLTHSIENFGGTAIYVVADAANFNSVKAVADRAVDEFGRLDTWVHCAGISLYARFEDTHPDEFKRIIDINLTGQAYGAMAALPHLKREGRGALIHVSSVEAKRAFPLQSAYSSSKHGMIGFLDALRMELMEAKIPISVTNVMPSGINTPLFNHARTKLGVKPMPVPPIYQPSAVADVILHAAQHPTRDIYAGGAGRMIAAFQKLSPTLVDKISIKSAFKAQMTSEPKGVDAPDNLFEPLQSHGRVGGDFFAQAKAKSLNNWLETHPSANRVLKGALIGGLAMWLIRRK